MKRFIASLVLLLALLWGTPVFAANCFWVGGVGGGNISDATKWSDTSGGAGSLCTGASGLPDATIDVFIDASSGAGTMTWDASQSWGSLDMTGSGTNISHSAAVTITAGRVGSTGVKFAGSGTYAVGNPTTSVINLAGTGSAATNFTSNAFAFGQITVTVSTASWVLQDTLNVNSTVGTASTGSILTHTAGVLNTNAQTLNLNSFSGSSASTRTFNITNSTINVASISGTTWTYSTVTGLTFTVAGSTINFTGNGARSIVFGATTYNTVSLQGSGVITSSGSGTATFADLSRTGTAVVSEQLSLAGAWTITGTLTLAGNSTTNRLLITSNTIGTNRTITAAAVALTNVDFVNITSAGAASPFTGTSIGDCTGNTLITGTAPGTRYRIGAGTWSDTNWSATSGGATGASMPICHDTAIADANSFSTAGLTLTIDEPRIGAMNWSAATNTPALALSVAIAAYRSWTLPSGMTFTGAFAVTMSQQGATTLLDVSPNFPNQLVINAPGGTVRLSAAIGVGSAFTLTAGTYDTNNFTSNTSSMVSSGGTTRSLLMGSGTWSLFGTGTVWNMNSTGMTFDAGTSTIKLTSTSSSSRTFAGGGLIYNNVWHSALTGTGQLIVTGANVFNNFRVEGGASARTVTFPAATTNSFKSVTMVSVPGAGQVTLNSSSAGSAAMLLSRSGSPIFLNNLSIQDITASGGTPWLACNSTDVSGNSNITFNPAACSGNGKAPLFKLGKRAANDNHPVLLQRVA